MLHPLLYTSTRLTPLKPYSNAVLARLIHPDIHYGNPTPRWFIQFPPTDKRFESSGKPPEEHRIDEIVENDPRIIFGETEFKTKRDKYTMPKNVRPREKTEPEASL